MGESECNRTNRITDNDIKKQYNTYKANGAIRGEIDFDKAIDTSITEKAVETIGVYDRE